MRGLEFWKNFKYRIKFDIYNPQTKELEVNFVTKADFLDKTFEYRNPEEIKKQDKKIATFNLEEAIDLMNSMVCNGYQNVAMQPYFE